MVIIAIEVLTRPPAIHMRAAGIESPYSLSHRVAHVCLSHLFAFAYSSAPTHYIHLIWSPAQCRQFVCYLISNHMSMCVCVCTVRTYIVHVCLFCMWNIRALHAYIHLQCSASEPSFTGGSKEMQRPRGSEWLNVGIESKCHSSSAAYNNNGHAHAHTVAMPHSQNNISLICYLRIVI